MIWKVMLSNNTNSNNYRWHYFENLAGYEHDICFSWIRNKNGSPKDILGWLRTVEIFMWSNLKVNLFELQG